MQMEELVGTVRASLSSFSALLGDRSLGFHTSNLIDSPFSSNIWHC